MLPQNCLVLCEQPLLLFFYQRRDSLLLRTSRHHLVQLLLLFGLIQHKLLLPKLFDVALVLGLTQPPLLGVHLLEPLVLCKLLHQLGLKLVLNAQFFLFALSLEPLLELGRLLQFPLLALPLLELLALSLLRLLLLLFELQFVA